MLCFQNHTMSVAFGSTLIGWLKFFTPMILMNVLNMQWLVPWIMCLLVFCHPFLVWHRSQSFIIIWFFFSFFLSWSFWFWRLPCFFSCSVTFSIFNCCQPLIHPVFSAFLLLVALYLSIIFTIANTANANPTAITTATAIFLYLIDRCFLDVKSTTALTDVEPSLQRFFEKFEPRQVIFFVSICICNMQV